MLGLAKVLIQELLLNRVLLVLRHHLYGLSTSLLLMAFHRLSTRGTALVVLVNHGYNIRGDDTPKCIHV
jgi:hypothetical protein